MKTDACGELQGSGWHERCRASWCECSCHGDEPPVREPRDTRNPSLLAALMEPR